MMGDLIWIALLLAAICAWFTHIFFCFAAASWGFLVAGAIFVPIGVIHGIYLWFN